MVLGLGFWRRKRFFVSVAEMKTAPPPGREREYKYEDFDLKKNHFFKKSETPLRVLHII